MKKIWAVTTALCLALVLAPAGPAAAETSAHPDIEAALAEIDGGVLVSYNEAHWPVLDMTMTVPFGRAVGSCATGTHCAFTGTGLTGTKLSWGTCGTATPPSTFTTRSIANARSGGTVVKARNGTTILASASDGSWTNVIGTVTNIRCLA